VIYRVKGILDIQIQHDRDSSTSERPFQEALQFGDLLLCASVRQEAFLHFVYHLVLFYGAAKNCHPPPWKKLQTWRMAYPQVESPSSEVQRCFWARKQSTLQAISPDVLLDPAWQ
jgi:hypothetical protein